MNERISHSSTRPGSAGGLLRTGAFGRALAIVAGGVVLIAGLFVSAVVFSVLLVVGTVAGGWFWWKTRDLRKQLRERMAQMQRMRAGGPSDGQAGGPAPQGSPDVLDGDFIRETDRPDR